MKGLFIKLLALLLVIATLLPMIVACKDDDVPPPNDDGDDDTTTEDGGDKMTYIELNQTSTEKKVVLDPASSEMLALNNKVVADASKGKAAIRYEVGNSLNITLPQTLDVTGYYHLEFDVYCESPSTTVAQIKLGNCGTPQKIVLDFSGWQSYKIRLEEFSVVEPFPTVPYITLSLSSGAEGTVMLLSQVTATKAIYELDVPDGIDINDSKLYTDILDKYRYYCLGYEQESYSAEYQTKLDSISSRCNEIWTEFKSTYNNGAPNSLFGYELFTGEGENKTLSGPNGKNLYYNLLDMAEGYATPGNTYYKNAELLADIKLGLAYGYDYVFGADIVANGKNYGNWWEWDIAIPSALVSILAYLENDLAREDILKYLQPVDIFTPIPMGAAANKMAMTKNIIIVGALERDAMKIALARELTNEVFVFIDEIPADAPRTNDDGGFKSDGSFIQHTASPLAGQYGFGLLSNAAVLMYVMSDSPFAFHGEALDNHYDWFFNCFRNIIYGTNFSATMSGRSVDYHQTEYDIFTSIITSVALMQAYAPEPTKSELQSILRSYMVQSNNSFATSMPFFLIDYATALKDNTAAALPAEYETTLIFNGMDRVMHHGAEYGVALAMSSTRIYKYESINNENQRGWYHGDGMLLLYTDGYDYGWEHFWYMNPYLVTGTTVNLAPRNEICISPSTYGGSSYAGGVSQGKYGIAGYQAASPSNTTYKGANDSKLTANKSYFFFDDEVVCLGSNIKDWSGYEVITTVDNRLWKDGDALTVNGAAVTPTSVETTVSARTMHFTGMGGYVFLSTSASAITYKKVTNPLYIVPGAATNNNSIPKTDFTGTSRNFLEITLSHGTSTSGTLSNNKYSYVYLPDADAEKTAAYGENSDVIILKNSDSVHAVLEKTLGIVAFNVFADGAEESFNRSETAVKHIQAETVCSVMISLNADGSYYISVSDPTQTYRNTELYITIQGVSTVVSADDKVAATVSDGTVHIKINSENSGGNAFNLTVK